RDRYGCAAHRSKGTCANAFLVGRQELEDRVLRGLKERLMAPDLVANFIDAFNNEMRNIATSAERESLAVKRTLADVERKLAAIVRAIEEGGYNSTLKARLTALEQEKAQAEIWLRTSKPAPVLRLHTKLPELYRSKVDRLAEALNAPDTVAEAVRDYARPYRPRCPDARWGRPASGAARRSRRARTLRPRKRTQG